MTPSIEFVASDDTVEKQGKRSYIDVSGTTNYSQPDRLVERLKSISNAGFEIVLRRDFDCLPGLDYPFEFVA
jgi:hypothetical protein